MEHSLLTAVFQQLSLNQRPDYMIPLLMPASTEYDIDMLHECQEYNSSHDSPANKEAVSTEGEDDDLDYEDATNELYVTPSNFETTINDPYISAFIEELLQDEIDGFVASFQKICYFNGADAYAVPHRGNHIQPASVNIAHIVEWWLTEKLSHTGETIPILEESPQTSAESIMFKLREVASALNGMAKVLINIRAGHVYSLHMIGDEIVMAPNYERFFQQFPLFVNVSIKVQEHLPSARHNPCQVLVAVEHVTMKDQTAIENRVPCKFSQHYHQSFEESFTTTRTNSSPDGQTFCLLEEVATNLNEMW